MERSALEMAAIICVRQPTVAFGSVAPPRLDGAGIRSVIDELPMRRPSSVAFVLPMLCSAEWLLSDPHRQDLTAWSRAEPETGSLI